MTAEQDVAAPSPAALYDDGFFRLLEPSTVASATAAVPIVLRHLPSTRVLDVGSGEGVWAQRFAKHGCEILCLDGDYVDPSRLLVPSESFIAHDLQEPLPQSAFDWHADLVVCLEVAEHLPPERGPSQIAELCRCSDRLFFSAAVPGQGGHGHVNERPHEYWIGLLEDEGFAVSRKLQRDLSAIPEMAPWYSHSALMAVRIR